MTVSLGSELNIETSPAGSIGNPASVLPGAGHISGQRAGFAAGFALDAAASPSKGAESFRTRWQSEIAAMHSAGPSDDGVEPDAAADMDAADLRAKTNDPGAVNGQKQVSGASGSINAAGSSVDDDSAISNSVISSSVKIRPEDTQPGNSSARSAASKDSKNNIDVGKRDHAQSRAQSGSWRHAAADAGGPGMALTAPVINPAAVLQQRPVPAPAGGSAAGLFAAGHTDADKRSGRDGGSALMNPLPVRAVQHPGGLAPQAAAAGGAVAAPAASESGGDAHGGTGDEQEIVSGAQGAAPEQAAAHAADSTAQAAASNAAGAQDRTDGQSQDQTGQSSAAADSEGDAGDASRESVSASRQARSPSGGQNPGPGEGSAAQKHGNGGGIGITPVAGVAGATHAMPLQPVAAVAGAPGSGMGNGFGAGSGTGSGIGSGIGSGKGAGETFAAMDAQANGSGIAWMHTGPHQAEAGFQDPTLGWVAVRAEQVAGGIHAAIVPGSADAAQTLGGHMAGLSAHLAEQRVGVGSVSIATPGAAPQFAGGGAGQNGGNYGAGGQNHQHQPAERGQSYAISAVAGSSAAQRTAGLNDGLNGGLDGGAPAAAVSGGARGRHISVVA